MKEEKRVRALQWLVDFFANLDLERIEPGDRAKLLEESIESVLWPGKELKTYSRLAPLPKEFSWALEIPGKKSPEYWNAIVRAQKAVRDLFTFLQISAHPSTGAPTKGVATVLRGQEKVLWWVEKGPGVPYSLKLLKVTESQEDYLRLKILGLLEGFNQHAIRRCPGCGKWFFNPTNHDKRFCGNRCIWRTNTAKRRAANKQQKGK